MLLYIQCQIEVSELIEIYLNTLSVLANHEPLVQLQNTTSNRTEILCLAVQNVVQFLHHPARESLQVLLARTGLIDSLIMLLFDSKVVYR